MAEKICSLKKRGSSGGTILPNTCVGYQNSLGTINRTIALGTALSLTGTYFTSLVFNVPSATSLRITKTNNSEADVVGIKDGVASKLGDVWTDATFSVSDYDLILFATSSYTSSQTMTFTFT